MRSNPIWPLPTTLSSPPSIRLGWHFCTPLSWAARAPTRALPLSSIDPPFGSGFRRRTVMIRGSGFVSGATVSFGGAASPNVTVVNSNLITARTPPHSEGLVDVVVTNPDGTAGIFASGFEFVEPDRGGCQSTPGETPFGVLGSAALILVWLSRSRNRRRGCGR